MAALVLAQRSCGNRFLSAQSAPLLFPPYMLKPGSRHADHERSTTRSSLLSAGKVPNVPPLTSKVAVPYRTESLSKLVRFRAEAPLVRKSPRRERCSHPSSMIGTLSTNAQGPGDQRVSIGGSQFLPSLEEAMPRVRREASHAGSWYSDNATQLAAEIRGWLEAAPIQPNSSLRAIIAPHAGYRYSGHVMAYAYGLIHAESVRIFLLGPSHHVYAQHCMLSSAAAYSTPFGDVLIDRTVCDELHATGMFQQMPLKVDEAEHSLEMHLPFIAHIFRRQQLSLVPVMVGAVSKESEEVYGRVLSPYFNDSSNLFIVSSDFCHWGVRFNFNPYDPAQGSINSFVKCLDLKGIEAIQTGNAEAFHNYMQETANTICGRHPIAILLQTLAHARKKLRIDLKKYDQSSRCAKVTDSSVSYAALAFA